MKCLTDDQLKEMLEQAYGLALDHVILIADLKIKYGEASKNMAVEISESRVAMFEQMVDHSASLNSVAK